MLHATRPQLIELEKLGASFRIVHNHPNTIIEIVDVVSGLVFGEAKSEHETQNVILDKAIEDAKKRGRPMSPAEAATLRSNELTSENEALKKRVAELEGQRPRRGRPPKPPDDVAPAESEVSGDES